MILEQLRLEEEVKRYKGEKTSQGKDAAKLASAGDAGEIGRLKKELATKDRDMENLKKQVQQHI